MDISTLFSNSAFVLFTVIIQVIVIFLGITAIYYIGKLASKTGLDKDSKFMENILSIVKTVVTYANEEFVNVFKKYNPNGKLSKEDGKRIYIMVRTILEEVFTDEQIQYIKTKFGDLDKGLKYIIEATVAECKDKDIVKETIRRLTDEDKQLLETLRDQLPELEVEEPIEVNIEDIENL